MFEILRPSRDFSRASASMNSTGPFSGQAGPGETNVFVIRAAPRVATSDHAFG